ncbi:MAG: TonB family protein [Candidatus Sulfotelmatobacter sp.]
MERSCHLRLQSRFVRAFAFALAAASFGLFLTPGFNQAAAQNASKPKRKVVTSVQPDYPYVLRNAHFEGQVKLEATVQPNGSVTKVDIKGGNPMLSQYAQMAVMRWKYAPGPAQTVEEVVFTFNSNSADTK